MYQSLATSIIWPTFLSKRLILSRPGDHHMKGWQKFTWAPVCLWNRPLECPAMQLLKSAQVAVWHHEYLSAFGFWVILLFINKCIRRRGEKKCYLLVTMVVKKIRSGKRCFKWLANIKIGMIYMFSDTCPTPFTCQGIMLKIEGVLDWTKTSVLQNTPQNIEA